MSHDNLALELTASFGEHLHPGARLVSADEYVSILDLWIEAAWLGNQRGDYERFCFLVELRQDLARRDLLVPWEDADIDAILRSFPAFR